MKPTLTLLFLCLFQGLLMGQTGQTVQTVQTTPKIPFLFLGVKSKAQPDISKKLEGMISKSLENLKKLDPLSKIEIKDLMIEGVITEDIPNEFQAKSINQAMGPSIIASVYLRKIKSKAQNKLWPPFSREITLYGKIELIILNTNSGELLFSGEIPAQTVITKIFSRAQTKEPYQFLNATDRDKMMKTLMQNFRDNISNRIQQVIAGFSFTQKKLDSPAPLP